MAPRPANRLASRARAQARAVSGRDEDPFERLSAALNPNASTHEHLLAALEDGVDYMLIGAHARNAYIADPRTTRDLDVVVAGAHFDAFVRRAASIVARSRVKMRDGFATIARHNTHFIDIANADHLWLYREALSATKKLDVPGIGKARVPRKEYIVAMKLMAALSPTRRPIKALQDRLDAATVLIEGVDRSILDPLAVRIPGAAALLVEIERATRDRP